MPEYLAPGVYTEETSFRARSIQGVGTSTTGFAALARTGPVGGPPRLITSFAEFERIYGGLDELNFSDPADASKVNYGAYAVRHFFAERGARVYFSRAFTANSPNDDGRATAALLEDTANGITLIFRSRFPGSGSDGTLSVAEAVSPATDVALEAAPVGALARSRGAAALPATLTANAAPAPLADGDTLVIDVNGAGARSLTISGGQAVATAQGPMTFPLTLADGSTVVITADGMRQVIPLPTTVGSAAALSSAINARLQNARASVSGDVLSITSDASGSAVSVEIETQTDLGVTATITASGPPGIARLDSITATDFNALLATAGVTDARFITGASSALIIETTNTGRSATLDISATDAGVLAKLGFPTSSTIDEGQDGLERSYFLKVAEENDGWHRYSLDASGRWATDSASTDVAAILSDLAYLVLVNFSFTNIDGTEVVYDDMSLASTHPRYVGARMKPVEAGEEEPVDDPLILEATSLNPAEFHAQLFKGGDATLDDVLSRDVELTDGNDGALPPLATWEAALDNLNTYDDISIVASPGSSAYPLIDLNMRKALIRHAAASGFRIAVLDPPEGQSLDAIRQTRGEIDSNYAAIYTPWVCAANPLARPGNEMIPREVKVPPSGHICGIYARNDQLRGVHKTPANEVINTAIRFETDYNQAHQAVLNPLGINCLRTLPGRGNRVYGGRLATSEREVLYVSDRRHLNFIKQSIHESMQWAVFEPNGPALWANVRQAVQSFLYNLWRNGALFGSSPDEAFFVVCDGTVMTQADIDNGRMICEVGLALLKPAEFVIFRIGQKTADARR